MNEKISIITAVYNGERLLPHLLESIGKQTYRNFQFIIIDGGSKDKTIDVIKSYQSIIDFWISEPDRGIYDAWNKGIEKATGNWIMFLGCDDVLLPNALELYAEFIKKIGTSEELDVVHSKVQMVNKAGEPTRVKGWEYQWPLYLKEMSIAHVGALHSRKFFSNYGNFDTNYKIVGDFELLLRAGKNLKTAFMDEITVLVTEGGVSDSIYAIKEHYKAVIKTGKYPVYKAFPNALIVYLKFKIKAYLRKIGLNFYLKKTK